MRDLLLRRIVVDMISITQNFALASQVPLFEAVDSVKDCLAIATGVICTMKARRNTSPFIQRLYRLLS